MFYILQEGSTLNCSIGFTGTITGNSVHLEVWLDDVLAELDGTVSGEEIHGRFSNSPFGSGSFRLVPTTVTFSHLDMQGTVQGMTVDFDTDYAVAEFDGTEYSYSHTVQVGVGSPWAHLFMMSRELVPGETYIVTDEDWEEDFHLSLQLWDGTTYWDATSGTVWIETYDEFGMNGDFTDLIFPDVPVAGMLSGTFNVYFFESNGEVSVNGSWAGNSVDIHLTSASSDRNIGSNTGFWIWYEDQQLAAAAWLGFEGELPPTLPWTFDDGPSIRYAFDDGSCFDDLMSGSGTLTLYSFSESGTSGSFTGNFPGGESITGNFEVTFVEGFGIEPPD